MLTALNPRSLRFMPRSPPLVKRYFVTMFLISCVLLAVFTFVIYQQSKLNEDSTRWVFHSYEVLRQARNVLIHVYDADAAEENFMKTGAPSFLAAQKDALARLDEGLSALALLTVDNPGQQAAIASLQKDCSQFEKMGFGEITAHAMTPPEVRDAAIEDIRSKIRSFSQRETDLLNARVAEARLQQHNYLRTLFFGAILDLGALVIANIVIFGLVARGSEVEEELRKSEERFRLLMHGINDGIFDRDLEAGTAYFSPAYKSMLGYTEEEVAATPETFAALLHPDDAAGTREAMRRYADHETPFYSSLFRMRHKDGSWRWILSRGVGIWDKDGKIQRLVGAHTDVTAQKEREEELKQLNADLEGFTYIASHDLRAPLVNLKGFSVEMQDALAQAKRLLDTARAGLPEAEQTTLDQIFDKDIPEAIGFIQSSVEKMDKLTGAILDLSRIGRREFHMQPVDTGELVQRCLDALAYEIGAKKIEVECDTLPSVVCDVVALEQIFGNILDNAVKYLDPARPGKIEIDAIVLSTEIIFSFRDNGRGIGANDEKKVFDIFRRAGNAGNIRGAGMGMAYVKATLKKLGGRIWFQSVPGTGTVFYVSLPTQNVRSEAA